MLQLLPFSTATTSPNLAAEAIYQMYSMAYWGEEVRVYQDFLDPLDYSDFKLVLEEGTHPDYMTHTRRGCVNFV